MSDFLIPLNRLVHENLSIVMCYAYSLKPLSEMVSKKFEGEWKYLNKGLFFVSAERAEKALMELALFLRTLDDEQKITGYLKATKKDISCGRLVMKSGKQEPLPFREAANKIIHSRKLEWRMTVVEDGETVGTADGAMLYCYPRQYQASSPKNRAWERAEIDLVALTAICGQIIH